MSSSNVEIQVSPGTIARKNIAAPDELYKDTFVETPSLFVSLYRQIRDWIHEPKVTVPAKYYRGEVDLPATDLRPWFVDLPSQIKVAFEKPKDPIGIYNHAQQEKRALCGLALALVLGASGWFWRRDAGLLLGVVAGFALVREKEQTASGRKNFGIDREFIVSLAGQKAGTRDDMRTNFLVHLRVPGEVVRGASQPLTGRNNLLAVFPNLFIIGEV